MIEIISVWWYVILIFIIFLLGMINDFVLRHYLKNNRKDMFREMTMPHPFFKIFPNFKGYSVSAWKKFIFSSWGEDDKRIRFHKRVFWIFLISVMILIVLGPIIAGK